MFSFSLRWSSGRVAGFFDLAAERRFSRLPMAIREMGDVHHSAQDHHPQSENQLVADLFRMDD